jgi:hypothetical protein
MADKSFGVKELNLLNASGTPTVTSPNNLNLNANTVAISTSCTIGNNLTVTSTINSANLNVSGIGTLTRAFATDLSVSGVSTITVPANANPHSSWDVVNNSASSYRFTGPGQDGAEDNPNIYLVRGQRYVFKMNASGHPFQIRVANGGAAYSDGVTNNGAQTGNVVFNVQHDAPAQLYYQCTSHGSMVGNIYIIGGSQVISGVVTATTFVGNLTGNVTGTASANAVLTGSTNNQLVTVTGANAITGEANLTFDGTQLSVTGSATPPVYIGGANPGIKFEDTNASGTPLSYIYASDGQLSLRADDGDETGSSLIDFRVDGTERLRIGSNGLITVNRDGVGGRIDATAGDSSIKISDGNGRSSIKVSDPGSGNSYEWELTSAGNFKAPNGKGIDFSATSDASGMTSELLDDYEEGSWTPASKNAGSFTSPTGRYVKIGQQVTVWCYIPVVTDITSSSNFEISGLPYTATSTAHTEFVGPVMIRWINSTSATGVSFSTYQASGWNYLRLYASRDDGNNYEAVKHSDFAFDTPGIRFCHSYTV